ncbi:hypothetical protein QEN19_000520 [Hanseniaspora menglaensis]
MSTGYFYSNPGGFNGYQFYQQQKNTSPLTQQQPFFITFDKHTAIEARGAGNLLAWIGDNNHNLSAYDILDNDVLKLYTRHSVKPYWRLKQANVGSNASKKDLATYMSTLEQKLPLINGFIPFDLVENNVGEEQDFLAVSNSISVINDIVTLNLGVVTITDYCNINFSDRKGNVINTMNPITHPYLMYSPNIINNNIGKCKLNCMSQVKSIPNVVVVGGYNMNQLVYVDVIANKIINRYEYTDLKNITNIKTPLNSSHIRDELLFVFYDSKFIDFIDPLTNSLIYTFSLQVTTNCQNDMILTFDVVNGNLVVLTNNSIVNFNYHNFKLINEIIIVSNSELIKPSHLSINSNLSNLLVVSNQKIGKIGIIDLNEFKSLVSFLSIEKVYNIQNNTTTPLDFVDFTPLGDKIVTFKNALSSLKTVKSYSVPGIKADLLNLFKYNANKVVLERASLNDLESPVVDECLNRAVLDYSVNIDSVSGLNIFDPFFTNYEVNDSLQMTEYLSKSSFAELNDRSLVFENIYSSLDYKNRVTSVIEENSNPELFEKYKYKLISLAAEDNPDMQLISQVIYNTIPKKHNKSIPSELLLSFIENSLVDNSADKLLLSNSADNGPPLIYRKLDIPISNVNESSGNNILTNNSTDLFCSKIYSKYNNTNYCGLYPLLSEEDDTKINLNSIIQYIASNPGLYSMIKNFLSEVPWQGKPLLIHEFGYFIDGLYGNKIYDNRILLNYIRKILPKNDCDTILQVYQFIDSVITKEYQQYYKKLSSNKKKHINGYITNAASGKKKTATGSTSATASNLGKYQKNVTNHLDVLLSKEFQYAKSNHNNITTDSLTVLAYMTDKEFKEVLSKNNNWLLPEFEVAISKISPQLFFKVDENEVIPKYCSSPKKYYLTSVVFNVEGPQKNQVTCVKFEDGWFLFNDHLVFKMSEKEILNLSNKLPMLFTYTVNEFITIKSITADLNIDMIKEDGFKFFNYKVKPNSDVAMDSEYVIENYKRQEISPEGSVKIIKQEVKVLARLTVIQRVVGEDNNDDIAIIFDDYVSHENPIEDYLTKFSGILPNDLNPELSDKKLHERQETFRKFWILVKLNCKIIGHGLKSDFEGIVINIPKNQIVDTAVIYWIGGRLLSLKFLYYKMFNKIIQGDNHDSYEDSYAAMVLYEKYLKILEEKVTDWENFLETLFEEGRKCGFKVGSM